MARDYSRKIKKLRAALRLTQHAFAGRLRVQPQVVASWEQGRREPSAASYRRLARLAPPADAWFFLQRIGVTKELVRAKWKMPSSPLEARSSPDRPGRPRKEGAMAEAAQIRIPVLRDGAPDPQRPRPRDIASFLSFPAQLFPKKEAVYVAVPIRDEAMSPALSDVSTVVLDQSQRDPALLSGRLVGLAENGRILVRRLAAGSRPGQWILQAENPQYPDLVIKSRAPGFLVGLVVSWWATQP